MFNATEFHLLRTRCPEELEEFLKCLGIDAPNWTAGDEFQRFADLDDKIATELSRLMKSDSVFGGYIELLHLGDVSFDYAESDNDLLRKIIRHKEKIREGTKTSVEEIDDVIVKPKQDFSRVSCDVPCNLFYKKRGYRERRIRRNIANIIDDLRNKIKEKRTEKIFSIHFTNKINELCNIIKEKGITDEKIDEPDLENKLRDVICEYWQEHRKTDLESIDIYLEVKTRSNGVGDEKIRRNNQQELKKSSPRFSADEIDEALKALEMVNDLICIIYE